MGEEEEGECVQDAVGQHGAFTIIAIASGAAWLSGARVIGKHQTANPDGYFCSG